MVITIIQLMLLPLAVGMLFHYRCPKLTARIRQPVRLLSITIFLGFIIVGVYGNFNIIVQYLHLVFLLVFFFFNGLGGMAMIVAWWGIWHLVSSLSLAMIWRQRGQKIH